MAALPVAPNVHVIDYRTYVHTTKRWVALCVVQSEYGAYLKFYKWRRRESEQQWKVDLARFSVRDVDLCHIAADAVELARQYSISLSWPTLEKIAKVDISVQKTPRCPRCVRQTAVEQITTTTTWRCSDCGGLWNER